MMRPKRVSQSYSLVVTYSVSPVFTNLQSHGVLSPEGVRLAGQADATLCMYLGPWG
jgi:hypothetical protein